MEDRSSTPGALREGVRDAVRDALSKEIDRTSGATVARLVAAGLIGVSAAVAAVFVFSGPAMHGESSWHLVLCTAAWSGLLVECFAFALLGLRAGRIPLGRAAGVGVVGLALASLFALVHPIFHWEAWSSSRVGQALARAAGDHTSALCLGICSALVVGFGATLLVAWRRSGLARAAPAAAAVALLLLPAVALQSHDSPLAVRGLWAAGTVLGAYLGVAGAMALARTLARKS